ncbi:MAG: signal peptidase I [Gemmatimonadota bacterium]
MTEESVGRETQEASAAPAGSRSRRRKEASFGRWVWEWTKSIFIAFLLFLFIRAFVVEAFQIPTASMENTLLVGDFLLVNKMVYGAEIPGTSLQLPAFSAPRRGDIIVFEPPSSAGQPAHTNYVKRVIGLPGDTLSMQDGVLYRNGEALEEPYVNNGIPSRDMRSPEFDWQRAHLVDDGRRTGPYRPTRDNWGPILVPADSYFVLGDNRHNSQDSRYWGFVPAEAIKGKPLIIYYSYDRGTPSHVRWLTEIRWDRVLKTVD